MPLRAMRSSRSLGTKKVATRLQPRSIGLGSTLRPKSAQAPEGKIRVLVAEDERRIRDRAANRLAKNGMVVRKVDSIAHLIDALDLFKPRVLILDDNFETSGVRYEKIMPTVRGRYPMTKIIVTTGAANAKVDPAYGPEAWGAAHVLRKASMFEGSQLVDSVRKVAAEKF